MDRNIDTSIRKPRRAKGTPVFRQRNIVALGTIALGGVFWYIFEQWSVARELRQKIKDGKFQYSPEFKQHILSMRLVNQSPELASAIQKLKQKSLEKQYAEEPIPQPWYSKLLAKRPEL